MTNALGFRYDSEQDIYYSKLDPWQRNFGYFDLYDESSRYVGMEIDYQKIGFTYGTDNGERKHWNIELWKGQYGFATGGEIGIYTGEYQAPLVGKGLNDKIDFGNNTACAGDSDMLQMSFALKKNDKKIFTRDSDDKKTSQVEKHWWLTGFKPGEFSRKEELVMEGNITFKDAKMAEAFYIRATEIKTMTNVKMKGNNVTFAWITKGKTAGGEEK